MDEFLSDESLSKGTANFDATGEKNKSDHSQIESSHNEFEHLPADEENYEKYDNLLDFDNKPDFPEFTAAATKVVSDPKSTTHSTNAFIEAEKQEERNPEEDYLNPYSASNKYGNDEKTDRFISSEDLLGSYSPEHKSNKNVSSDVEIINPAEPEPIVQQPKPEPVVPKKPVEKKPTEEPKVTSTVKAAPSVPAPVKNVGVVDSDKVERLFKQVGLDAWFQPERLHPKVESLIYWRDPKKSGIVFGIGLSLLLAMSFFSLISVFAYVSLLSLVGTLSFRIYKAVLQAIHKTAEGNPFKEYLELDLTLSQDKLNQVTTVAVAHINAIIGEFRRLFLVEDLIDSIKFGAFLWFLTYVGAMFNGMTLIILAFVALFTLPKVYENNKQSIDSHLDVVRNKVSEITEKVKAAIPIGKKTESEKEK